MIYNSEKLTLFQFDENLPSIGEYVEGAHWKDLDLSVRIGDVVKSIFKILFASVAIGSIVGAAIPPFSIPLALLAASVIFVFGGTILGISIRRAHQIDLGSQQRTPFHSPGLAEWSDNSIMMTENAAESTEMKLRLIRSATHSIEISGSYCGGEIFDLFLDEIDKKLESNPNLKVKIISNDTFITASNLEKITEMQEMYPNFFFLQTEAEYTVIPTLRSIENHTKLLIVDGTHCLTGGTGIQNILSKEETDDVPLSFEEKILGKKARDMDVVITGPIAETMRHEFYQLLSKWQGKASENQLYGSWNGSYEPVDELIKKDSLENEIYLGKEKARIVHAPATLIVGSYEHGERNGCKRAYLKLIQNAKSCITIANMSINEPEILEALKSAAENNIQIKIITSINHEEAPFSMNFLGPVNRLAMDELTKVGASCYGYREPYTLYHKKIMVVDEAITVIGSFNLSSHCAQTEDEDIVVIDSEEVAKNTLNNLAKDEINSEELEELSFFSSMKTKILSRLSLFLTKNLRQ